MAAGKRMKTRKRTVPPGDRKAFEKYWSNARHHVVGWYALLPHQRAAIKHIGYRCYVNGRKYEIKKARWFGTRQ
jgi:hypothetical protein